MIRSKNVFLVGLPGVGKSTIGKQLSEALKLRFYDADREIEKRCGTDLNWIFDLEGEEGFRKREQKVIHELTELQGIVLATGGGCILTKENRIRLSARGFVVYLEGEVSDLLGRMEYDQKRPLLRDKASREETLQKMAEERDRLYREIADMTIRAVERSVRSVVQEVCEQMQKCI